MDVKKVRVLLTAADFGSLNKAAEALQYTQAGLTSMMNALEKEVGLPLLVRGHGGVRLTPEAELLRAEMERLIQADDVLEAAAAHVRDRRARTLRVGTLASISVEWMPDLMARFRETHPDVTVECQVVDLSDSLEDLLGRGGLDLVFTSRVEPGRYEWVPLAKDSLLAVVPPTFDTGGAPSFDLRLFEGQDVLVISKGEDANVYEALAACEVRPNLVPALIDDPAVVNLVNHGLGFTILPKLALDATHVTARALPLDPPYHRELGIMLRSLENASEFARAFVEEARRYVKGR